MKRLIEKYNQCENIIFISSYPEKNARYSAKVCAVGGFTKNTVDSFKSEPHLKKSKYIILTTTTNRQKEEIYEEKKNLICRVFRRNKMSSYLDLLFSINKFTQVKTIIIQFEFASFGDTLITALFPLVLLYSKILGKKIILVVHQVVENLGEINGHLGWNKNDNRNILFNTTLKLFYKLLVNLSDKTVVLEEEFRNRLIKITGNSDKISVINHGVDTSLKIFSKNTARKKLKLPRNKFIFLYFGYLTWYKGADIFIQMANKNKNPNNYFILAGGPSFTQKNKPHYQKYLKQFNNLPKNTLLTGFVDEKNIPFYFSAADAVVLPYRTMISSSGPLSLVFSFEKPVLLSNNLKPYLKSKDFLESFKQTNLIKDDIFFSVIKNNFINEIAPVQLIKLSKFSQIMKLRRNYLNLAPFYLSLIRNQSNSTIVNYDYNFATSSRKI